MVKPEISIIMPCYNVAQYVAAAIDSVLAQEVPVKLIAIDDGSSDGTLNILDRYADSISILESKHVGVCAARNKAISKINTSYVLFLDADDFLQRGSLYSFLKTQELDNNCVVYGNFSSWDPDLKSRLYLHKVTKLGAAPLKTLSKRNISPPGAILFPSNGFEKAGIFDESLVVCEDWDFFIRLARCGYRFKRINKEILCYRRRFSSASNHAGNTLSSGITVIRRCHQEDPRIKTDLYQNGYRPHEIVYSLFNFHAVSLAVASFSGEDSMIEKIMDSIEVPDPPDWRMFANTYRQALWWNSFAYKGDRLELILDAQVKCVRDILDLSSNYPWCNELIRNILFPDFRQLLARPGPKKAFRLFKEWKLARRISSLIDP